MGLGGLCLGALLLLGAGPCRADSSLYLNAGWGFFQNTANVFELSQWVRAPILDGVFRFWRGTDVWIGASEGWYLGSDTRTHYFEFQMSLNNMADFPPIGISFGPGFTRGQGHSFRGSLWGSIGVATLASGFERDPVEGGYVPYAGLILKIPLWYNSSLWRTSIHRRAVANG